MMSEVTSILPPEFSSNDLNVVLMLPTIKPRKDSKIMDRLKDKLVDTTIFGGSRHAHLNTAIYNFAGSVKTDIRI